LNIMPFSYFGGKYGHLQWLLKRLPQTTSYVEPFGGSGVVLINKQPVRIETYNDINSRVVNFFTVLRNNPKELLSKIYLTPYSKEEYLLCYNNMDDGDDIEKARKFFTVVNQSFNGTYSRQTGWKMSTNQSRTLISESINRYIKKIPNLLIVIERFRRVQISNYDFREIFEKFNSSEVLIYCDPPYMHDVRCNKNEYEFEMSEHDHIDLLKLSRMSLAKVAISGYDNDLYNDILSDWHKEIAPEKRNTLLHSTRSEVLWTNYDPNLNALGLFQTK